MVRVEITDLTKPQEKQVLLAPARIFPPRIKTKNRTFYRTPPSRYNGIAKEEFAMKDNLKDVGIWGQRHYQYLKENKPSVIGVMRMKGTLNSYLRQVNEQADEMCFQLVKQLAKQEGITEELKCRDQMAWVGAMNNIRDRVNEIVLNEVIFV